MTVKCRHDCEFYSSYTDTCDYTLLMYQSRGCPTDACTKYVQRSKPRSWSRYSAEPESEAFIPQGGRSAAYIPEPSTEPPEEAFFITAGCGHEVYEGEELYQWENGETLCPECMEDKFSELGLNERAELLGCDHQPVHFPKRR